MAHRDRHSTYFHLFGRPLRVVSMQVHYTNR